MVLDITILRQYGPSDSVRERKPLASSNLTFSSNSSSDIVRCKVAESSNRRKDVSRRAL
jgi:hypothetical protein